MPCKCSHIGNRPVYFQDKSSQWRCPVSGSAHPFIIPVRLATAIFLSVGAPSAVDAQVLRGRLVGADDGNGIGGAMLTLVDRSGRMAERVLSRDNGVFEVRAAEPGEYRLKAERIGYETTFSDYVRLAAADTLALRMVARVEAISLQGIETEADRRCRVRPEEGLAVTRVWNEARKALAAAAWTQDRGMYRYEMMGITRQLDRKGHTVISEDRSYRQGYRKAPFVSVPADELIEGGFATFSATESVYRAPDAGVLLSNPFLDTHCFRLKRDEDEAPGLIGLAFEPVPGRRVAEIAGTLWIDPVTSRLKWLGFLYRNLDIPDVLLPSSPGGRVDFQHLPNGTWIVNSWWIRMPRGGSEIQPLSGRLVTTLQGATIQGGEVLRVHGNEGVVLQADTGGRIAGIVFDSLHAGLPGARVFIAGSGTETTTGPDGRFELTHLESGRYSVNFTHPYLERFSYRAAPFEVEVVEDAKTPAQVNFAAPTLGRVIASLCRDVERPNDAAPAGGSIVRSAGILVGRVTDAAGRPVSGVTVGVFSRVYDIRTDRETPTETTRLREGRIGAGTTTNALGFYRACWVPVDTSLEVAILGDDEVSRDLELEAAYTMSDLIARRKRTIIISSDLPYEILDLRIERGEKP